MGILSGAHLGQKIRFHMGDSKWDPYVGPRWVISGKLMHGRRMGNINGVHLGLQHGIDMGKHNQFHAGCLLLITNR